VTDSIERRALEARADPGGSGARPPGEKAGSPPHDPAHPGQPGQAHSGGRRFVTDVRKWKRGTRRSPGADQGNSPSRMWRARAWRNQPVTADRAPQGTRAGSGRRRRWSIRGPAVRSSGAPWTAIHEPRSLRWWIRGAGVPGAGSRARVLVDPPLTLGGSRRFTKLPSVLDCLLKRGQKSHVPLRDRTDQVEVPDPVNLFACDRRASRRHP